jgi:hypothetical protein
MILVPNSWASFREANDCHLPRGRPDGGQFGSKGQCGQGQLDLGNTAPSRRGSVERAEAIVADAKAKGYTVLFHSGDASINGDLADAIQPMFGDWVTEVLAGATDSDELVDEIQNDSDNHVAFFSKRPEWVSMKAARKAGKDLHDITIDDVRKHGQLSIVVVKPDDEDFLQAEDDDEQSSVFLGTSNVADQTVPFGVERGDIYTRSAVTPATTLVGDDLVLFLQRHYPDANIIKGWKSIFRR